MEKSRTAYKKKERARAILYKDPFKFVKKLFTSEKNGILKASSWAREIFGGNAYRCKKALAYVNSIRHPTYQSTRSIRHPTYQSTRIPNGGNEYCAPKWKDVEHAVRKARASSSPGPNGVPYRVYKSASGALRILWKLLKVAW